MSALTSRVGMGTASTVARPWVRGQATGRVDVPVDAIATSFGYEDVAPQHRSPQCIVLVNQCSHVEKKEKTVFVKEVEGKTRVRRVVDSTQIWELLDEGIDMWVAVNGKRVDRNATMAQIGIHDQDSIRCYGRVLGGRREEGSTVQARHSRSVDMLTVWAGRGVAHKKSMFSVW